MTSHYFVRLIIKDSMLFSFSSYRLEHPFLPSPLFNHHLFTRFPAIYFRPIFTLPPTQPSLLQINIYTCTFGPINHVGTLTTIARVSSHPKSALFHDGGTKYNPRVPRPLHSTFPLTPLPSRLFPRPFSNFHVSHHKDKALPSSNNCLILANSKFHEE